MKMIIDIPDNELKVPLRNIHLLISNGIVTEVCIKKYDKDEPYFMNLNYTSLEECEDVISRQEAIDVIFAEPLYKNGMKKKYAEEAVPSIFEKIKLLPPVTPAEKVGQWIVKGESWYCSRCNEPICEIYDGKPYEKYCPNCGAKMQEVEE